MLKHLKSFTRHPNYMNRAERIRLGVHAADVSWKDLWKGISLKDRKSINGHYADLRAEEAQRRAEARAKERVKA
jgi:hypothetical protein